MRRETPLLHPLLFLPYLLIFYGLALGGMNIATGGANLVTAQGAFVSVFFFHF